LFSLLNRAPCSSFSEKKGHNVKANCT